MVDGGSTDGTLDILQRYPYLRVISEPDQGMYDAINKGIELSQGDVIGFLNSDDLLEPNIVPVIVEAFNHDDLTWALSGAACVFSEDEQSGTYKVLERLPPSSKGELLHNATCGVPAFNAWFFRKELFARIGSLNLRYRIAADRDFLLRLLASGLRYMPLDRTVYHYRHHPGSLTISGLPSRQRETRRENIRLSEDYIVNRKIQKPIRHQCIKWHTRISLKEFASAMRDGRLGAALKLASRGWLYDPLWPLRLLRVTMKAFLRNLQQQPREERK